MPPGVILITGVIVALLMHVFMLMPVSVFVFVVMLAPVIVLVLVRAGGLEHVQARYRLLWRRVWHRVVRR